MRAGRTLVALVAALALALGLAGSARAATPAELLARFQPVMVFHPDPDEFRPVPVEGFVGDATLDAAVGPATWAVVDRRPTAASLPTTIPPLWRLNQRHCFAGAPLGGLACYVARAADEGDRVVYGRVAANAEWTALQYWHFYYHNLYRYPFLPEGAVWQSHEGDWEVVSVVLETQTQTPLVVGYSQHCTGETRAWAATQRIGTHPVVYVARGSHANYFEPGLHPIDPACFPPALVALVQQTGLPLPADVAAVGPVAGPAPLGFAEGIEVRRIGVGAPAWTRYPGFWGELQYVRAPPPFRTVALGTSPVGPAFQGVWRRPLGALADWLRRGAGTQGDASLAAALTEGGRGGR